MERAGEVSAAAGNGNGAVRRSPSTAPSARVSIWESVRACGIWGKEVDKAELRRQVVMPLHLRRAVAAAVAAKDEAAGVAAASAAKEGAGDGEKEEGPTVAPVVVFVNSRSGGRHGPELKVRLHELITEEQVGDGIAIHSPRSCNSFASRILLPVCFRMGVFCFVGRSGLIMQLASDCLRALRWIWKRNLDPVDICCGICFAG